MSIGKQDRKREILALLCAKFPKTFFVYERRRRPLKVGIHRDIEAVLGAEVDQQILGWTIGAYVFNVGYLSSLRVGAERLDLDGNPAGVITEADARFAQRGIKIIKDREQKRAETKREEPPPPRPAPRRDGLAELREAALRRKAGRVA